MSLTYHRYGVVLIDLPFDRLWSELSDSPVAPRSIVDSHEPADASVEVIDHSEKTHTLAYRARRPAPEIEEYVATCTLTQLADDPGKSLVEWTRAYRPAAHADRARSSAFAAGLLDRDQAIAAEFAAAYNGVEALLIDYTLGGAQAERQASSFTRYAKAA
jgi:hypothetical protein